ncbi:MAG: phosphopentomutase [Caldiserica bacterium]|nr:phosphopentomutase [Caldisericota bacterium]
MYNILGQNNESQASWGKMTPESIGKSTVEGHWEMMGQVTANPFDTFPEGFSNELLGQFTEKTGRAVINARVGSGTKLIALHGDEHIATGKPIIYTSADSVLQIAAHEDIITVGELYQMCEIARDLLINNGFDVARVIARPFIGESGNFIRTSRRKDFVKSMPEPNVIRKLKDAGIAISTVGRTSDLFGNYADNSTTVINNIDALDYSKMFRQEHHDFIFANLEDFDMSFGHRRDKEGFAESLCMLDSEWTRFTMSMGNGDLLLVVSDHGNDPTFMAHTDHTRENTILLAYMKGYRGVDLGMRKMVDTGATICEFFGLKSDTGTSFLEQVKSERKTHKN